jgi:hypothetical protein
VPACFFGEVVRVAIDDLPLPVVNFLNVIGVPWPYVNEDTVMEFSSLVRRFGLAVETTHQDGTRAVAGVARAYRSAASERMLDGWQKLSDRHVSEILDGCAVLAEMARRSSPTRQRRWRRSGSRRRRCR